jgi:DNA-binding SARP family transcriptional activator
MKHVAQKSKKNIHVAANAALFNLLTQPLFLKKGVSKILNPAKAIVVSEDPTFLPDVARSQRINFAAAGLDRVLIDCEDAFSKLKLKVAGTIGGIVIDMRWTISNAEARASLEHWGSVAEHVSQELGKPIISVYDYDLLIEEHLQAVLRVHSKILAPSGIYDNPYWLPANLLNAAALDEQLAFMLGRVVPDHEGLQLRRKTGEMYAHGATPSWLPKTEAALGASSVSTRWQIHCFGQLRVSIAGQNIDWRIAGGAPKKSQTLFAYLLQCGAKGANAEQISELLWPDEESDAIKRSRLHHTIAMLRKTLGLPESIVRSGDTYRLNAPAGSWIDINTFEQHCRRGLALFKKDELEQALRVYLAADQLYTGELFEELPREYVESENENWCIPRRIWLREMALKLQNDLANVLMRLGRTREALEHCQKALAIDPASEVANEVAIRIFAVQGREDAVHRQYKQYQQALKAMGEAESAELRAIFRSLFSKEKPKNAD